MRKYVITYDICSSTTMLENLTANENTSHYEDLVIEIAAAFENALQSQSPQIYKFLGDGYIYLVPEESSPDRIIEGLCDFVEQADASISAFTKRYIDVELPRYGVTVGVAYGSLFHSDRIGHGTEYYGRPINLACRLQGSLKDIDQADKILVQKEVFQRIENKDLRRHFNLRKRSFHNINADQRTHCYEIDPYNEDMERNQT